MLKRIVLTLERGATKLSARHAKVTGAETAL